MHSYHGNYNYLEDLGLSEQVCGVLAINVALDQKYKEDINE